MAYIAILWGKTARSDLGSTIEKIDCSNHKMHRMNR